MRAYNRRAGGSLAVDRGMLKRMLIMLVVMTGILAALGLAKFKQIQLAAAEAQRDLARANFDRMQGLLNDSVISRSEFDRATADRRQTDAKVGEIRAAIDRKTIRAPFSGVLGLRQVNLGQYLGDGAPVVSLQAMQPIYVNFGVPQQAAAQMRRGFEVRVTVDELAGPVLHGRITALDSIVDSTTRNIQIQATLPNAHGELRPGMFVQTEVAAGAGHTVITLPASAINYAPYGDSVFVVSDLKAPDGRNYKGVRQQFVKLDGSRGDQVAVSSGVKPAEEVVTSGVFKLRNGAAVQINNKVQPANSPAPKPENS
jgi:membrane fusion protein (multidrug efflux system)